jgi:hypothetical protein
MPAVYARDAEPTSGIATLCIMPKMIALAVDGLADSN